MTDLDLTRYEGHTAGPWSAVEWTDETPYPAGAMVAVQRGDTHDGKGRVCEMIGQGNGRYEPEVTAANARLIADAPLLLAEVRRLREENAALNGQLEQQLRRSEMASMKEADRLAALRQSHERLLAAVKVNANRPAWPSGLCWCPRDAPQAGHVVRCAELRAAVAEAEAL